MQMQAGPVILVWSELVGFGALPCPFIYSTLLKLTKRLPQRIAERVSGDSLFTPVCLHQRIQLCDGV